MIAHMAARSKISKLPEDIRAWLDAELIRRGFGDYEKLESLLEERGFEISKSALHRYGQKFEDRVQALKMATDQAKAITMTAPDDEGAVSDALMRLVQEKLFTVLMEMGDIDPNKINLGSLAKSIAELGRASVTQKKWQVEVRTRAAAVADRATEVARKGGLSAAAVDTIRREILGIPG